MPEAIAARLIGSLFVERGLVSESQIRVALEIQRETGDQLGKILVEQFGVPRKELTRVVAEQWRELYGDGAGPDAAPGETWRPLGEIFVTRGFVSEDELDEALRRQRQTGERLGEALVGLGVISKFELAGALGEQMATLQKAEDEAEEQGDEDNVVPLPERTPLAVAPPEAKPEPAVEALPEEPEAEAECEQEPEPELVLEDPPEFDAREQAAVVAELVLDEESPEPEMVEPADDGAEASVDGRELEAATFVAYASTTKGYRLVTLDGDVPDVGQTIDVPDVGELVVMRRGHSPLPLDGRPCIFLELPLAPVAALQPA